MNAAALALHARRAFALGLTLLVGSASLGACAEILGIDSDFEDVVREFCKCDGLDQRWPEDFSGGSYFSCEEWVRARFEARPDLVAGWLDTFDQASCAECSSAEACAAAAPLCIEEGEPCISDASCCGYSPELVTKAYCGFAEEGTRCFADPEYATCKQAGEACSSDADCCGNEGLIGQCLPGLNQCLVICDEVNDAACPGCCAIIDFNVPDVAPVPVCLTSLSFDEPLSCDDICVDSCSVGFGCAPTYHSLVSPPGAGVDVNTCVPIIGN